MTADTAIGTPIDTPIDARVHRPEPVTPVTPAEPAKSAAPVASAESAASMRSAEPVTPSEPARPARPARRARPARQLARRPRRVLLVAHVAASVGWLGLDLAILTLGITGLVTGNAATERAAYLAMQIFGDVLVIPIALVTTFTGVVLSVRTPWGLVKYWWVLIKFVLTIGAASASVLLLRPQIAEAVHRISAVPATSVGHLDLDGAGVPLVAAPTFAFGIYLFCTAVSVVKPWGRTRWGRRR